MHRFTKEFTKFKFTKFTKFYQNILAMKNTAYVRDGKLIAVCFGCKC
jgi:hypothetical protein